MPPDQHRIQSFFEARAHLPSAGAYPNQHLVVTVGSKAQDFEVDLHVPTLQPLTVFLFRRCEQQHPKKIFEWICADTELQQLVYENYLITLTMLKELHIEA